MKWFVAVWLLCAGLGVSFSVVKERRARITLLKEMEHSLKKLAYYMYQWKMPAEEAFRHVARDEKGGLSHFFQAMHTSLEEKKAENLSVLWQEKSSLHIDKKNLLESAWVSWQECFFHIPMEPEALNRSLILRAEEIAACRAGLEEKYMGEQKLVLTLGIFTGAFICLVLW